MEFVPVDIGGDFAVIAHRNYSSDTQVRLGPHSPTHTSGTERNANRGKFSGLLMLTVSIYLMFTPDHPSTTPCTGHKPTCLPNSTTDLVMQFPRGSTVGRVLLRRSLTQGRRFRMCPATHSYNSPDFSWGSLPVCTVVLLSVVHSCSSVR